MRQLRGFRQTLCEGRFGAHVLKKRALCAGPYFPAADGARNKGGTADIFRPLDKGGFFIADRVRRKMK